MKRLALLKMLLEREQKRRDEQMAQVRNAVANAESQQQSVIEHAQRMVEIRRQRLIEREIRVATVERLIKRREALLAKVADRRDQKNLDELAQRVTSARANAGMS